MSPTGLTPFSMEGKGRGMAGEAKVERTEGTEGARRCAGKRVGQEKKPVAGSVAGSVAAPTAGSVGRVSEGETAEAPLRPSKCRAYMRRELAREFRGIVKGFVEGAKTGSCQHVKLATALVDMPLRPRNRGKQTIGRLIREMEGLEDVELGGAGAGGGRVQ